MLRVVTRSLQPRDSEAGEGCPERVLVEERAQKEEEAGGRKEGADRAGLGAGSDGKGGVEVNSRISRPGFRVKVE